MNRSKHENNTTVTSSDITLRTSMFPGIASLIDELSMDLGKSSFETIALGLVMLKIVMDAGQDGKRVAITDDDLNVEKEILIPGRSDDEG